MTEAAMNSSIRPVTLDDVVGLDRYEVMRDEVRRRIIELKRSRRLSVGPDVTFVFENHDTVYFQIQEMLRAERITDLDAVRAELQVYNALLPQPGELSATMLIEITEPEHIAERLLSLLGIDEAVWLQVGSLPRIAAQFEPGRSKEDKLSAVQYLRFLLPPDARAAFLDPAGPVNLVIDHPRYQAQSAVAGSTRASLSDDLRAAQ
jgi:hypothetical protein